MAFSSDIESEIDALYQLPLAEFVPARNALAKRLTDKAAAKHIRKLEKPNAAAWALNRLGTSEAQLVADMIANADEYRGLQRAAMSGATAEIPPKLSQMRREMHNALVARALVLLKDAGKPASKATARQINTSLESLAAFGSTYDGAPLGRLAKPLDPPGIEVMASLAHGLVLAPKVVEPAEDGEEEEDDEDEDSEQDEDEDGEDEDGEEEEDGEQDDEEEDGEDGEHGEDGEDEDGEEEEDVSLEELIRERRAALTRVGAATELVRDFEAKLKVARELAAQAGEELAALDRQIAALGEEE